MLTTTPKPVYATTIHDDTLCNLPQPDPPEHEKRAKSAFFFAVWHIPSWPFLIPGSAMLAKMRTGQGHCHAQSLFPKKTLESSL